MLVVTLAFVLTVVCVVAEIFVLGLLRLSIFDPTISVGIGRGFCVFDSCRRRPAVTVSLSEGSRAPCSYCH